MKTLIVGGTGLISTGIVKHLLGQGAEVTVYNRGQRQPTLPQGVTQLTGNRDDQAAFVNAFESSRFDVVFDMICFNAAQAEATVRAFGGRTAQLIFCSTVCVYGGKIAPQVLIDESFTPVPLIPYGSAKLECERIIEAAAAQKRFASTIVRPSHTYGPGASLIDQHEFDSGTWDRVARGLPVFCTGDGLGLWQSTHRDDCGQFFAHAAGSPVTFGQTYNATRDEVSTWRDYYRQVAAALDTRARLVFVPAAWLLAKAPQRFAFLAEITQFHGAYSSAKARAHVPEFQARIALEAGARETFADLRRRHQFRDCLGDTEYQSWIDEALALGFPIQEA